MSAALVLGACQDHHFVEYDENNPIDPTTIGKNNAGQSAVPYDKPMPPAAYMGSPSPGERASASFKGVIAAGEIRIDDTVSSPPAGWVLYVIARPAEGGPPVAAARFEKVVFPHKFKLTEKNVMMTQPSADTSLILSARLDEDGDPISKGANDLVGKVDSAITVGAENLLITLKKTAG